MPSRDGGHRGQLVRFVHDAGRVVRVADQVRRAAFGREVALERVEVEPVEPSAERANGDSTTRRPIAGMTAWNGG